MASCRSWVAEQIVSKLRTCSGGGGLAVAPDHAAAHVLGDREGLAREHGGLIRETDPDQVGAKIEAGGHRLPEPGLQRGGIAGLGAALDPLAHQPGFFPIEHHQRTASGILEDLARGGPGFLVPVLAMDDRGETVPGIALDPFPHVEDRSAGGIHHDAADPAERLEIVDGDPEGRKDHHVGRGQRSEVEAAGPAGQKDDPHPFQPAVDVRVMNDLAHQEEPPVGKLGAGFIGVFDRPIHPVAEPELPGQPEGERAHRQPVVPLPEGLDQLAVVIGGEQAFDGALESEPFPEIRGVCHGGNLAAEGLIDPAAGRARRNRPHLLERPGDGE